MAWRRVHYDLWSSPVVFCDLRACCEMEVCEYQLGSRPDVLCGLCVNCEMRIFDGTICRATTGKDCYLEACEITAVP